MFTFDPAKLFVCSLICAANLLPDVIVLFITTEVDVTDSLSATSTKVTKYSPL